MSFRLPALAVAGLAAACTVAPSTDTSQTAEPGAGNSTINDGAFTREQAERGKRVYDDYCVSCHPTQFYQARIRLWEDASLGELFGALSATMPAESPGALSTSEYLDVLAYILSITGSPAGSAELTLASMDTFLIVLD